MASALWAGRNCALLGLIEGDLNGGGKQPGRKTRWVLEHYCRRNGVQRRQKRQEQGRQVSEVCVVTIRDCMPVYVRVETHAGVRAGDPGNF